MPYPQQNTMDQGATLMALSTLPALWSTTLSPPLLRIAPTATVLRKPSTLLLAITAGALGVSHILSQYLLPTPSHHLLSLPPSAFPPPAHLTPELLPLAMTIQDQHQPQENTRHLDLVQNLSRSPHTPDPLALPFPLRNYHEWEKTTQQDLWPLDLSLQDYKHATITTLNTVSWQHEQAAALLEDFLINLSQEPHPHRRLLEEQTRNQLYQISDHLLHIFRHKVLEHTDLSKNLPPPVLNALLLSSILMLQNLRIALTNKDHIYPRLQSAHFSLGLSLLPNMAQRPEIQQQISHTFFFTTLASHNFLIDPHTTTPQIFARYFQQPPPSRSTPPPPLKWTPSNATPTSFFFADSPIISLEDLKHHIATEIQKIQDLPTLSDYDPAQHSAPYYQHFLDHLKHTLLQWHHSIHSMVSSSPVPATTQSNIFKAQLKIIQDISNALQQLPTIIAHTLIILLSQPPEQDGP